MKMIAVKHKILFCAAFLMSIFCGVYFWNGRDTAKSGYAVEAAAAAEAVDFTRSVVAAARKRSGREFSRLAEENSSRELLSESRMLLKYANITDGSSWQVMQDPEADCLNVSCTLEGGRKLLVILRRQPDNKLKFVYAIASAA